MNPLDEFLETEKVAFSPTMSNLGQMAMMGVIGAGTTAAVAGAVPAAKALYGAATKGRDFKSMLAFDPELKELHKANPKYVNAGFNTLRRMNPDFAADPMVSSAFVKQVAYGDTQGAFGLAQEALRAAPKPGAMQEAFVSGAGTGIGMGMQDFGRQLQESRDMSPQDKMKMQHGYAMEQQSAKDTAAAAHENTKVTNSARQERFRAAVGQIQPKNMGMRGRLTPMARAAQSQIKSYPDP